jgi:hypothetical protein
MRMVIDSNFMQADGLRAYLTASKENHAVLTEYAAIEAYKSDPEGIHRSIAILSDFPRQVLVLKGTREVCGLRAQEAKCPDNFIDFDQTRGFNSFCRALMEAQRGNQTILREISELNSHAARHMDCMLADMQTLNLGFAQVAATYSSEELRILRGRESLSPRICQKVITHIFLLATEIFASHPEVQATPRGPEVRNTFIFRYAISSYVLALKSIELGNSGRASPSKLRNDVVDVNFATFATYFDGLLSADKKAQSVYAHADFLLREVFAMPEKVD